MSQGTFPGEGGHWKRQQFSRNASREIFTSSQGRLDHVAKIIPREGRLPRFPGNIPVIAVLIRSLEGLKGLQAQVCTCLTAGRV
jgi:hypothetical protein